MFENKNVPVPLDMQKIIIYLVKLFCVKSYRYQESARLIKFDLFESDV